MSLSNISIGRYMHGDSIVHRLDPRTKLFALIVLSSLLFTGSGWTPVVAVAVFAITAAILSGLGAGYLIKSLLPFKWLIIMTFALNLIFEGGHILVEAPLPYGGITEEGLIAGIDYSSKIILLVFMASLLTLTTEPIALVDGIEKLIAPLSRVGVKPHEVSLAMVITIRFIPILIDEAGKVRKSHIARGLNPDGGIAHKLKSLSMLFLPLFHSALRRAETLAYAMECRLYRADGVRTKYAESLMHRIDWVMLGFSVLFSALVLIVSQANAL